MLKKYKMWNILLVLFFVTSSAAALVNTKETISCGDNQWQCRSESCIDITNKCDGTAECIDGSDETYATCRNNRCPDNKFRCAYGACIDPSVICDHQPNCNDNSDEENLKCLNTTNVVLGKFKCKNGQIIPATNLCDGIPDCSDISDESMEACTTQSCPPFMFQCAYGACIDQGANCNGVNDCADGSDEQDDICKWIPPSEIKLDLPPGYCMLPQYPPNGGYTVVDAPNAVPGLAFDTVTLNIFCNTGYGFPEKSQLNCSKGIWSSYMPYCDVACKLEKDESVEYKCIETVDNKQKTRSCGDYEINGILVHPECKPTYYYPDATPKYMECRSGEWDHVVKCVSSSCQIEEHRSVHYECVEKYATKKRELDIYKVERIDETKVSEVTKDEAIGNDHWKQDSELLSDIPPLSEEEYYETFCDKVQLEGTVIRGRCKNNYYKSEPFETARCVKGRWDRKLLCTPECGQWNRTEWETELPPWHAGIYSKMSTPYKQICGGSLIKETVVISAAHCFWTKKLQPAANYAVAVGKIYRNWKHADENYVQRSNVSEIKIPSQFAGALTNYEANIALVFVSTAFTYNNYVSAICLDFDVNLNRKHLHQTKIAKIAGWGLTTEMSNSTQELKVADLSYIEQRTCFAKARPQLQRYITDDKICAESTNGETLCRFDAGEGLAFPDFDTDIASYYLRGVVSFLPLKKGVCVVYGIFTHVLEHRKFIEDNLKSEI